MDMHKETVFAERSVLSDKYIFAKNAKLAGFFNELEWNVYEDYFNWLVPKFNADKVTGIVYLNTSP